MSDLKPCPFCGGEAERVGAQGIIRCMLHTNRTHDGIFPCPAHGSIVTFAWMWNRRAHDATETASLRKVRDEMRETALLRSENTDKGNLLCFFDEFANALDEILKERE